MMLIWLYWLDLQQDFVDYAYGMLKEKMAAADLVVLGTPIYGAGITGQLKTFLDRISILYLQKKLAGVPGVTVVTAGISPREPIHEYLAGPMAELGAKVIARLDTTGDKGRLHDPEDAKKRAEEVAETVFPYATGEHEQIHLYACHSP